MKRARDIRDQLEGLLERVEIEPTSNPSDLEGIKKAITSGKFLISFEVFFFSFLFLWC
jgi:pre-mRNA-splicing factor ATP-dependent RNA helicase DHX16